MRHRLPNAVGFREHMNKRTVCFLLSIEGNMMDRDQNNACWRLLAHLNSFSMTSCFSSSTPSSSAPRLALRRCMLVLVLVLTSTSSVDSRAPADLSSTLPGGGSKFILHKTHACKNQYLRGESW